MSDDRRLWVWRTEIGRWVARGEIADRLPPSPREPIPARGWMTLAVVLVCAPAIAAGVLVADRLRALADRSAIPARWRAPLLGAACLALAGVAAMVWRWTVGL